MVKPASSGPLKPEIEYPNASMLKLRARSPVPPTAPVAFCADTWNSMNETPISDVDTKRTGRPGKMHGRRAPTAMPHEPSSMGLRTPTRSERRPAATASSIGRKA